MSLHTFYGNTTLSLPGQAGPSSPAGFIYARATQLVARFDSAVITKARRYIPTGSAVIGSTITLGVYVPATSTDQVRSPNIASVPAMTASGAMTAIAGWNEVTFSTPVTLGYDQRFWVVGYQLDTYPWPTSLTPLPAAEQQATDSSQLFQVASPQATAPIERRFFSVTDLESGNSEYGGNYGTEGLDVEIDATTAGARQKLYLGGTLLADIPDTTPSKQTGNLITQDSTGRLYVGHDTTKSDTGHTHPITDITTTGTANASSYLRGDGSWATLDTNVYNANGLLFPRTERITLHEPGALSVGVDLVKVPLPDKGRIRKVLLSLGTLNGSIGVDVTVGGASIWSAPKTISTPATQADPLQPRQQEYTTSYLVDGYEYLSLHITGLTGTANDLVATVWMAITE